MGVETETIHPELASRLEKDGVELDRLLRFLDDLNEGKFGEQKTGGPYTVPDITHPSILDVPALSSWTMGLPDARKRFSELGIPITPESLSGPSGGNITFSRSALEKIGVYLYPRTAFGFLNGGAASSYADIKKNNALSGDLLDVFRDKFDLMAGQCRGKPKGITPAYMNEDGTTGYSFQLLKFRMLLAHKARYAALAGPVPELLLPAFQMTSVHTDEAIARAMKDYEKDPLLTGLAERIGCAPIDIRTGVQPMMAAITHSSEGSPRRIFDRAYGKTNTGLPIPGGHGQNFEILAPVYRALRGKGIRYLWLGNIDNMGYTMNPLMLAVFALSGREAAFETAFRTPMDIKGGVLVTDPDGHMTCADIGPAIKAEDVLSFEASGKTILFNCGTGLFDLDRLVPRLDSLPYQIPLRITDQDKDAGLYAQAEQITWEIIGLMDDPLFFAVRKTERFLAAKLLMETLSTSLPREAAGVSEIGRVSLELNRGLEQLLSGEYLLEKSAGRWKHID